MDNDFNFLAIPGHDMSGFSQIEQDAIMKIRIALWLNTQHDRRSWIEPSKDEYEKLFHLFSNLIDDLNERRKSMNDLARDQIISDGWSLDDEVEKKMLISWLKGNTLFTDRFYEMKYKLHVAEWIENKLPSGAKHE